MCMYVCAYLIDQHKRKKKLEKASTVIQVRKLLCRVWKHCRQVTCDPFKLVANNVLKVCLGCGKCAKWKQQNEENQKKYAKTHLFRHVKVM